MRKFNPFDSLRSATREAVARAMRPRLTLFDLVVLRVLRDFDNRTVPQL